MLLSVDTSTGQMGLALYDGVQVHSEMLWQSRAHHTQELAPAVVGLLERAGIKTADLTCLAVATGPGSFTSLRVGLAFVKGLAMARHLPLIGIPTLDVTAAAVPVQKFPLVAVLPAGRGRIAAAWYRASRDGWQAMENPRVTTAQALDASIQYPAIVCGELSAAERALLERNERVRLASPAICARRPALLAEQAWMRWQAGQVDALASLAPVYLHTAEPIEA
jgi:tRNA threonylcarbamoyladenosine biosynthesis protein TsaB